MALAGLVADYTDSEASGGDEDEEAQHVKGELVTPKVSKAVTSKEKHSTDFFSTGDTGSSDSETETTTRNTGGNVRKSSELLPNPLADSGKSTLPSPFADAGASVFGNRFAEREKADLAKFEKHVKMTEDHTSTRPPCFKFKRGACNKGKGCRFSHDLGFQPLQYQTLNDETERHPLNEPAVDVPPDIQQSKKRVGVTNTMLPAKKAKQSLQKQRAHERPWTVGQDKR